jgi:superfamily II DNA or RNA helicase
MVLAVRSSLAAGARSVVAVLATGGGKSRIMAEIVRLAVLKGNRCLFLVHRRGLVNQFYDTCIEHGAEAGKIMAGEETNLFAPVQVATIQTFARRAKLVDSFGCQPFLVESQIVFIDETHRACSKQYKDAIDHYRGQGAIIIGFTATPARGDGRPLGDVFEKLVQVIDVQELTDLGYLSPCRYFAPSAPSLDDVNIVRGDYDVSALDKKMNQVKLVGDVVGNWLRLAPGRKTIVFAVSVAHSKALSAEFNRHGIPAYHLQASSSDEQREYAFQEMERGNIQVICNVALYQEGTDVPAVSCIILARPTKNLGLYRQMAGRGLRPVPGKELYLLDHGGCIEENGLLTDPIEWTLEGKEKAWRKAKGKEPKEKKDSICSSCAFIFSGSKKCPTCGSEAKSFGKKVETLTGDLEEIGGKKKSTMEEKIRFYGMLLYYGRAKGFKPGWSYWKYKERFGVAPKNGLHPPEISPDEAFYSWMKHLVIKFQKGKERVANVGAN